MPQPYRGRPRSVSRFVLPDGQLAVLIPRERRHFSKLRNGYPLAEEFLKFLATEDVDAIVIDDGERLYVFDVRQYRIGHRVGHEPYPMKRVVPLEGATLSVTGTRRETELQAAEWVWVTEKDLQPAPTRGDQTNLSSTSRVHDARNDSLAD